MDKIKYRDSEYPSGPLTYGYLELRSILKEGDRFVHMLNYQAWKQNLTTATDEDESIAAEYIEARRPNTYLVFVADSQAYYNIKH